MTHGECSQPSARRPPDSLRGHADTGPPLSRSGRLYLKPASGGRPTDARLVVEPESAFFPFRECAGPPSIKKARYYRKVGGMAWHKERKHPFPTKSRKGVRQAASSADHWLPQTLCMGAFHHTLVSAPGASPRLGTTHKPRPRPGVAPNCRVCGFRARGRVARALRTRVRSPHALLLVQWRLVAI